MPETTVRQRCIERGEVGEQLLVGFNNVMIEIWRGNFAEATQHASLARSNQTAE
jgi:hypothetical protein